ncbi:SDR family NAD(P)-dependent oxidoreductase [Plantactinospora endophytica]|uniref:Short-chain dehydrogenase n=1 Tax=Plantactinospora endophytica TaxID=673535 RepID=A0ABQ4EB30_9ACTN|nr:SDR family NAD(P)-dependent oxidoreductase [Plantactinospora endophytica]GIG91849.1 short-chain dehydrogenase [Plantactinospora endophytica]
MADRSVLITGGGGGLGGAVSAGFVAAGWRVVVPVRPAGASGPAGASSTGADGVLRVTADLTDPEQVAGAVEVAGGEADAPLRAVVNLAGGYASGGLVHETPVADFELMLVRNLRPTFLVTRSALPYLVEAGGGSVVCVSSRAALAPFPGAAGYVTAKAAVLAFASAVAVEYRQSGVRCNTVVPSVIDTPANRAAQPNADHSRWVAPTEIAGVIRFLASDESAPTSGATIPVYGRA